MRLRALALSILAFAAAPRLIAEETPRVLPTGSSAPDFCLPGVDDATHCLKDYASAKLLVVIFTCDHCPTAQLYETRLKQLVDDYRDRGVAFMAIEPNNPEAIRLDELGHTDLSDSLAEMKIRASYRHFNFPYLYDGETQKVSRAYGPTATPHLFIFDAERRLRYDGRLDNNPRPELVTRQDARLALDALLAGKAVAVAHTPAVGCSTKWLYKESGRKAELARIESQPVSVRLASADDLRALRANASGKLRLVNFWATWCGPCLEEFPELETTYRMYKHRAFDMVTVSINYPDEKAAVLRLLQEQHATGPNFLFGSTDLYSLMAAFDEDWNGAVPYTVLLAPGGEILYRKTGAADSLATQTLELRRLIMANIPDDDYHGLQAYWRSAVYGGGQPGAKLGGGSGSSSEPAPGVDPGKPRE